MVVVVVVVVGGEECYVVCEECRVEGTVHLGPHHFDTSPAPWKVGNLNIPVPCPHHTQTALLCYYYLSKAGASRSLARCGGRVQGRVHSDVAPVPATVHGSWVGFCCENVSERARAAWCCVCAPGTGTSGGRGGQKSLEGRV